MIAAEDVIYVRYRVPDLDVMERFLLDFGMRRALRTDRALFMRGVSDAPYLHVSELGESPKGLGFGLRAASAADLQRLADAAGARVEANPLPGGGNCVRLTDPAGFEVWVHHGLESQPLPQQSREPNVVLNVSMHRQRHGVSVRTRSGPSTVYRLGHVVMQCPDPGASFQFYSTLLGFKVSDAYYKDRPDNIVGRFLRCGLGEHYTDHHTLAVFQNTKTHRTQRLRGAGLRRFDGW